MNIEVKVILDGEEHVFQPKVEALESTPAPETPAEAPATVEQPVTEAETASVEQPVTQ